MDRIRVRLRVGITVIFLLIVVPLSVAMIGFIYSRNAHLARQTAEQSMELSARLVNSKVGAVLDGMAQAVDMAVAFGKSQQGQLRQPELLRPMMEQLQQLPGVQSLYYGLHEDGAFFQILRPTKVDPFISPMGGTPPDGAKWVMRTVEGASGQWRETILYLAKWGKVVGIERAPTRYDPRERPWYRGTLRQDGIALSDVYQFSSTQQAGLTVSRRLTTSDGARLAVFAADMTLSALSAFLQEQKVGTSGKVFILDAQGRLIGHPDIESILTRTAQGDVLVPDGAAAKDPVIAAAVNQWRIQKTNLMSFQPQGMDSTWIARFTPFANRFGSTWTIGVVVDEDDFTGPVKEASKLILLAGAAFLLLAGLAILWTARMLVRPIHALIGETERIRRFELDKPVKVISPVLEIDSLASAISSMKAGLASFGTYVPKSLVHSIIQSGIGTTVGGERRPLTVMFTDLQGFTAATESMAPEQVLHWLSDYFNLMSSAIHAHHGTIDKYIGDAVMALWNAPLDDDDHVANACRAMLACRDAALLAAKDGVGLKTRMGLHTGTAVVGNVGASDRMQYTALGAMVNLASRVESLNKQLGTQLLVTGDVARAVTGRFTLRPMGRVLVVGTSLPMDVHELLGEGLAQTADVVLWSQAVDAVTDGRWQDAQHAFQDYAARNPDDKAAALYLHNLTADRAGSWDGVLRFDKK
ncbi:adenylate/guanylate cyclase domain-containing protein [Magnetospirillum sp. 64-120]|uniref:adenylate/guanylate cyclase domain-containing protein n=1 Tax=Magnetospirillum sp. 64-120 TaxID=1895778 RepID=UPI0025C25A7F|nr:adenylate/guanylate cyclase domain-containing protein [Magnetospirillum sp. 64-120]